MDGLVPVCTNALATPCLALTLNATSFDVLSSLYQTYPGTREVDDLVFVSELALVNISPSLPVSG